MKKGDLEPPTYFLIYLVLTIGLHFILPIIQLIHTPYRYSGILFIGIGLWLNLWADGLFKKKNTAVKPSRKSSVLILEGPFRFSRHPMYLGMVIALIGMTIILGSLITFLPPIAFFITMQIAFIPYEEKAMEEMVGEEYLDYKNHVRCWM